VTTLVLASPALEEALRALPAEIKGALRARRHPDGRWIALHSRSYAADCAARELADRFGEGFWREGRWVLRRAQLRLPGF